MEREYYKDDLRYRTTKAIEQWKDVPPEKIGEELVDQSGEVSRVNEYYRGAYPSLGALVLPEQGWSGDWETARLVERFPTVGTIYVHEQSEHNNE